MTIMMVFFGVCVVVFVCACLRACLCDCCVMVVAECFPGLTVMIMHVGIYWIY